MTTQTARILCVDDEPQNLKLLEAMLIPKGYEVMKAADAAEALEIIGKDSVDLVLLDIMMPGMNGFEACLKIKSDEHMRNIPVVMITALRSKEDRVKGIESGADDFISKPFDQAEVLARIKMLLEIKGLNDRLNRAYNSINYLTNFGEKMIESFDPLNYDLWEKLDEFAGQILRKKQHDLDRPEMVVVGLSDRDGGRDWLLYLQHNGGLRREVMDIGITHCPARGKSGSKAEYYNSEQLGSAHIDRIVSRIESGYGRINNAVSYHSDEICIHAFNYGQEVTSYDAAVLNNLVMQSLFLKSLSSQVKDTEEAFKYTVQALARAAEVNDEDTGNHITRVGEYCAVIAVQLGMDDRLADTMRLQAQMHDVGKIHTPPEILKKPAKLTPEEWEEMKKHTIYGTKILGDHVRLAMAKEICLSHHERWDGSGYPYGLKEERIPISGRIMNIADQYDALRTKRVYKPAFDHETTYKIITEGDGRTMPHHFDPEVLKAFMETASRFEEVYERLKG